MVKKSSTPLKALRCVWPMHPGASHRKVLCCHQYLQHKAEAIGVVFLPFGYISAVAGLPHLRCPQRHPLRVMESPDMAKALQPGKLQGTLPAERLFSLCCYKTATKSSWLECDLPPILPASFQFPSLRGSTSVTARKRSQLTGEWSSSGIALTHGDIVQCHD